MNKTDKDYAITAIIDQQTALTADAARIVVAYYESLKKAGLPENLVHDLTIQYAELFWGTAFSGSLLRQ